MLANLSHARVSFILNRSASVGFKGVDPDTKVGGMANMSTQREFLVGQTEPPSEASQLRKGGPGVLPRKFSKTYMANGAIYVIPELYL